MTSVVPRTETLTAEDGEAASDQQGSRRSQRRPVPSLLKRGAYLQALAALLWLPQAGILAYAIGRLADTGFDNSIYYSAAGIFVLGCLRSLLDSAGATKAFDAARLELSRLRTNAVSALAQRSPLDVTRPSSGEAASILAEQAEMVVPYLSRFVPVRIRVMLIPFAILAVVLWYSWAAALVLMVAAPLIPIFMALIGWRAKAASEKQLTALGGMNGFLLDRLRGLATIRTFHAVDATANRLRQNAETLRSKTMTVLRIAFLSSAVLELFAAIGVAMVAVYIGFHLLGQLNFGAWGHKLTLAEGLFVLLLSPAFFEPLRDLSAVWHDRAAGEASIDALEKLAEHPMPIVGKVGSHAATGDAPTVTLHNIDFGYGTGGKVLTAFNLDIAAGEHVALLAPSGYGKSTVLALVAGLTAPQTGQIEIGGIGLAEDTAEALRSRMSWIGQKPHIFAGSARQNITLGRQADVETTKAIIDDMALGHVLGVTGNSLIGENGAGISGGEALRLALSRAAVDLNADIILADEPTAHLDQETAKVIADSLLRLAKGKTLIVATHDETLARRMDRIVRLDGSVDNDPVWQRRAAE
ncbi:MULTISPECIES: thiol reductant ABC exporter subunit CydD [Brucella/Ochrobactrum group]|uniref:ABC transporter CydDC cysteine exporter (CydDC-E) family permease/ATP-binding protein CydD n=1 Tax=Brucella anthropi (strain ATCC 49188 / DSM 6882 / CCUG 24695 / JCM 21032 / LMG 3331 / NBRC 15819 / NCTC 12168 / Alc 37) TaxID=439375 RepID=A6X4U1_BRUA4|nr:thiol reductant ABC exporter subunit CydD [Brucella anthropi]MCQ9143724.1 thiol reductant ABC exporter subunit CydD [Ochrobactrum sp. BTU2]ABS16245.1 ABC transporter CydDC cysteine exporter (CydDC-E) family permease/ATP-binding protein CydD [Brucella anthropi ATCC 49188]AIK41928.1 thiol reductant ABC exporter, CydD subunit [Brucella anthropi]KAB2741941.1 thiol reductant ABC exporter subunit CydD [Brucella anthropi]KAB2754487.1 thiol reductant ABC exporter subunit CydD [Brucella anthropi]